MSYIQHQIILDLRYGGFKGEHLDRLMAAEVITERPITCKFAWNSTCEGPDSWRILLLVASPFAIVGTAFLKKLGEDLYGWLKTQVKEVFSERSNGDGFCELKFDDVIFEIPNHPSEDCFAEIWLELPQLLGSEDLTASRRWRISYDEKTRKIDLHPSN